MTPEQYRSALLQIAASLTRAVSGLLRLLPRNPDDRTWAEFVRQIYPQLMAARLEAYRLSTEFYDAQRTQAGERGDPIEVAERQYPQEVLDKTLTRTTRARLTGIEEWEADRERIERQTLATLERHTTEAGHNAVVDASRDDPKAIGYARVPSGAETCAFCTMLVSRGPVYQKPAATASTAGTVYVAESGEAFNTPGVGPYEPFHNNCDCILVPVFDLKSWPGRDASIEAEKSYKAALEKYPDEPPLRALKMYQGELNPPSDEADSSRS